MGPIPAIFVRLKPFQEKPETAIRAYRVAGCRFWTDTPLTALEAFREPRLPTKQLSSRVMPRASVGSAHVEGERQAEAWLGGARRLIRCGQVPDGHIVQAQSARFFVRDDGKWVELLERADHDSATTDLLLGPVLVLALALQRRWCLHGGAVIRHGAGVLFLGESGRGKSTIAAMLSAPESALRRLADDVVPVAMNGNLYSLPPFPQYKVPAAQQYAEFAPIVVEQIYVLEHGCESAPETRKLDPGAAALAIAEHTLMARLFPEPLLANHIRFCAQVAEKTEVTTLKYPHTARALDRVKRLIQRD